MEACGLCEALRAWSYNVMASRRELENLERGPLEGDLS